ncbi:MAG: HhH-GPD-type base excision DNA repair protein [Solirubrobacterales bacterium]
MPKNPKRLYFTESDEANELNAQDPMALIVGFVLDQQVTVQKAFAGPLEIKQRVGSLDAEVLASTDLDPVFREKPAIHRYPGNMAKRVQDVAAHIRDEYDGDAAKIWTTAKTSDELREHLMALPGFGEMKVKSVSAVLSKQYGVKLADDLVPWHPTLGDVDSLDALAEYQAAKKQHKKQWSKAQMK